MVRIPTKFGLIHRARMTFAHLDWCADQRTRRVPFAKLMLRRSRDLAAILSISLLCGPALAQVEDRTWEGLGPEGLVSGSRIDAGAVNSVALHPSDADTMVIASVNGGLWRTTNATDANPIWQNVSQDLPSLSTSAVTYDLGDATNQTLYAGFGLYSSFGRRGSDIRAGVWRSTNGGVDWTDVDGTTLDGQSINAIVANGNLVLVSVFRRAGGTAAAQGLYLGENSGGSWTWTQLSGRTPSGGGGVVLPAGRTFDVSADPSTPNQYFVMVDSATNPGLYRATLTGANPEDIAWTRVSDATVDAEIGAGTHGRLDVGPNGEVFVATNIGNTVLDSLFRSPDGDGPWTALDTPITNQFGNWFLAIAADPNDTNTVYVAGGGGGRFRVDASQPSGSQSTTIRGGAGTMNGTSPHADARDLAFDANDDLIEGDDGGVYRQTDPTSASGDWVSINNNLVISEIHSAAWDGLSHIAMGGFQDNGTNIEDDFVLNRWTKIGVNDGGDVAIDDTSSATQSLRYLSTQNLGGFAQLTYDLDNNQTASSNPTLAEPGCPAGAGSACSTINGAFKAPFVVNQSIPTRLVIAGGAQLWESADQGQSVVSLGNIVVNANGSSDPIAAGANGNNDALYVGSGDNIWVRTSGGFGAAPTSTDPDPANNAAIVDVVIDPNDDLTAYAIDTGGNVYMTTNAGGTSGAGAAWTNITGNLGTVTNATLHSIAYSTSNVDGTLIVGANDGVYFSRGDDATPFTDWAQLGVGLPLAPVYDLDYSPVDEILIATAYGRGVWAINMEERDPIDVALVMDKSGSMGDPACSGCDDKITVLKDAAEIFVQTWQALSDADDRIAAVFFDSAVEAFSAAGDELPTLATNGDNVITYIQSKGDGGATAMGGGAQRAIGILSDDSRPRSIILFTDGMQNRDPMIVEDGSVYEIANTGATGSGVSPTTPPTQLDDDLDISVNTIGVGVTDSVNQTLSEISGGAGGLHKRTNNADADLRRFYIEQLVDTLRDASPQLIDYRYPRTNGSGRDTEDFRINVGAKKVVFAVSWDRRDASSGVIRILQDGVDVTSAAEEVRSDSFYRILAFDTSARSSLSSDGTWRVDFQSGGNLDYEVAALADDGSLNYQFAALPALLKPTEATTLAAQVAFNGLPHGDDVSVRATIDSPTESLSTVLATTPTPPELETLPRHPGETFDEAKYRYLWLNDADFRSRLEPQSDVVTLSRSAEGRFTTAFSDTRVAGAYKLSFLLEGDGPVTGAFERREQRFLIVVPGPFDEGGSTIETGRTPGGSGTVTTVRIRPVDIYGNFLGSGGEDEVSGVVVGSGETGVVTDAGDGWYVIEFDTINPDPTLEITLGGDVVATGAADDIEVVGPGGGTGVAPPPSAGRDGYYAALFAGAGVYLNDDAGVPAFVGAPGGRATFDSDIGLVFGGAIGKYVGPLWGGDLRIEGEVARRKSDIDAIAGIAPTGGDRRTWTLMANAAVEFDTPSGLRPYAGVGVGAAFNRVSQPLFDNSLVGSPTIIIDDDTIDFAWQVFGGASVPIASRVDLFVQGRYLDAGGSSVVSPGGTITDIDLRGASGEAGLRIRF